MGRAFLGVLPGHEGMGLHIMKYRAGAMGGRCPLLPREPGGTQVVCAFPREHLKTSR